LPRSRAETSKRALARIQRLCCLGIGSKMLMPDLMGEVTALIASQHGLFYWTGPNFEIINAYNTFPASLLELYFKEFYMTGREAVRPRPAPVSNSVVQLGHHLLVDRSTFLRSDYYNLLWRQAGVIDALRLEAREASRIHGTLYVWRGPGDVPFQTGDFQGLGSIAAFVAHAMTPARVGDDGFADSDDRALFVADLDGKVVHAGEQAQHLLIRALNPGWSPTSQSGDLHGPVPEIACLCRALIATANGQIGQPPPVLRLRTLWGEFVLRAYWFGPTDGTEQTRHVGVTIERRVPRALVLHRRVEELPLTGREKQLCLLWAHDLSRKDLADAIGVSTGTVITHQSNIYAKLGVHSRAELLAALLPG
jgi:DNA-binding CsgD family transcriptional regulator